jgi:coenzyme F420-reducing hydrogenase delta subunit
MKCAAEFKPVLVLLALKQGDDSLFHTCCDMGHWFIYYFLSSHP